MAVSTNEVNGCLYWWIKVLNLSHWRIGWKIVDQCSNSRALMEIKPTRLRLQATICINRSVIDRYSSCTKEFQQLLVHELTHLIYDPIAEEHGLQLDYSSDKDRYIENKHRFNRCLERAVEHTAQMLVDALPLKDFN